MNFHGLGYLSVLVGISLLSACQKPPSSVDPRGHTIENLINSEHTDATVSKLDSVAVGKEDWIPVAMLGVDGLAARDTAVKVRVSGAVGEDGEVRCNLVDKIEPEKVSVITKGLPIWLHTLAAKNNKLNPAFASTLSFKAPKFSTEKMSFLVRFQKGEFYFQSLWKVTAVKNPLAKDSCIARGDVCFHPVLNETTKEYECSSKWKWLSSFMAIPDKQAFILQFGKEVISKIKPETLALNDRGELVRSPEEPLDSAGPWGDD